MLSALIHSLEPGRICQIVPVGSEFEVHPNFSWVTVPDDTTTADRYNLDGGTITKFDLATDPAFIEHGYRVARGIAYGGIGDQLDMLYHELMATGTISSSGTWATHITEAKTLVPKDNPAAVIAWNQAHLESVISSTISVSTAT